MNGYVNKQNYRIWDDTNPYEVHQIVNLGPAVTLDHASTTTIMVTPLSSIAITTNFLLTKLKDMDLKDMWSQQIDEA